MLKEGEQNEKMYREEYPQNNNPKGAYIFMQQEKISSAHSTLDYAIYGAVVQARYAGIIKPVYTTKEIEGGGYDIAVDGYQRERPWYDKYYNSPYIDKVIVTSRDGAILNIKNCTLAVQGYVILDDTIDADPIETRYTIKLLSEPLQGMKPMQSNIKEEDLQGVIHAYWAIQQIEDDLKNLNDKENYEVVEFVDEYIDQYHLTSKERLQTMVRAFKAKPENLIEPRANKEKIQK